MQRSRGGSAERESRNDLEQSLRTVLIQAQKEMNMLLTFCKRNYHTPLVVVLQFYPEATKKAVYDQVKAPASIIDIIYHLYKVFIFISM